MASLDPDFHLREAARLLEGQERYFNGGQTVRHDPPEPNSVERAKAHALVAQGFIMLGGAG